MPFYIYEINYKSDKVCYAQKQKVSLAGTKNAVYHLWTKKSKPLDKGWQIGSKELVKEVCRLNNIQSEKSCILIDCNPKAKEPELVELLDIYLYTYEKNGEKGVALWSVLMLRIRKIQIEHGAKPSFTVQQQLPKHEDDIFEFLYLQGDEKKWIWGRIGQVNAAYIDCKARMYFKPAFSR